MRWSTPVVQEFYLHDARLVGLPAGYWIEARNAGEAMVEAHFAADARNHAKASAIRRRVAETALARLREIDPGIAVEVG